jgi:hypothetical protein
MLTLGATGAAYADAYTCNESGNPPPPNVTDADITEPGSCTLDYTVTATGEITINAGGDVNIQGLAATDDIYIDTSGDVTADDDITSSDGAVDIYADSYIDIQAVTAWSDMDIEADEDLTIGDDASSNGGPLYISAGTTADTQGLYAAGDLTVYTGSTFNSTDIVTYNASGGDIYLYPGDDMVVEGNVQADGSTTIQPESADVTVSGFVEAYTGFVDIEADNVEIDSNIFSAQYVSVIADDDSIDVEGYITANSADGGGNVLLQAQNDIGTGAIYGGSDTTATAVEIDANLAGGNDLFTVGGDGETNGVNGTINAGNNTGGGTATDAISGGVFITNGTAGSTGGITVVDGSDINVTSTAARSGFIILQAQSGDLTISGGTLSADGTNGAGDIELLADSVVFGDSVTVTVSQPAGVAGNDHPLIISTNTISAGSNLVLHADGDGASSGLGAYNSIVPFGAHTRSSNYDVEDLVWPFTDTIVNTPVNISGSSSLTMTANGAYGEVGIFGDGSTIWGTDLTLTANGTNTQVNVYAEGDEVRGGIAINSTGNVFISANGVGGAGGAVLLYGDAFTVPSATGFTVEANGPSAGDGGGGTVEINANSSTFGTTFNGILSANAASDGNGNAVYGDPTTAAPIAISFFPGTVASNITLGTSNGQWSMSANGGSAGGNAGTIAIEPANPTTVSITDQQTIVASALGGNGNGGWIYITPTITSVTIGDTTTPWSLVAQGHGTGTGGQAVAKHSVSGLNVNAVIKVDGGTGMDAAMSDGKITLNNIPCYQWLTSLAPYPLTYWNCVDATRATGLPIATAANTLENSLQNLLATTLSSINPSVQIYDMNINDDYRTFFGLPAYVPARLGNFGVSRTAIRVSISYASVHYDGGTEASTTYSGSPTIQQGTISHELGHQLDYIWGNLSSQVGWTSLKAGDYANMDAQPCTTVYPPALTNACAFYPGKMNSQIFVLEFPLSNNSAELFAAMFEHVEATEVVPARYSVEPKLEQALTFFPSMIAYIQGVIAAPPAAVN